MVIVSGPDGHFLSKKKKKNENMIIGPQAEKQQRLKTTGTYSYKC